MHAVKQLVQDLQHGTEGRNKHAATPNAAQLQLLQHSFTGMHSYHPSTTCNAAATVEPQPPDSSTH
jgi:hypothetical protein